MRIFFVLFVSFLFTFSSFGQNVNTYTKEVVVRDSIFRYKLTINGQNNFILQFNRTNKGAKSDFSDSMTVSFLSPELVRAFISKSEAYKNGAPLADEKKEAATSKGKPAPAAKSTDVPTPPAAGTSTVAPTDTTKVTPPKAAQARNILNIPDTIVNDLYLNSKVYIANFFNDKTAENWGMEVDKFEEMQLLDKRINDINDRLAMLSSGKRGLKRKISAQKNMKKMEEGIRRKDIMKSIKDSISIERSSKKMLVEKSFRLKRQNIQPTVFLSGSALSFLNNTINSDSVKKSNIMAIGVHGTRPELWDMDAKITLGQDGADQDVIIGTDRSTFGSTLLVPGIRRYSFLSNYRAMHIFPYSRWLLARNTGFGMSFNVSQIKWQWGRDSLNINGGQPVKVIPVACDAFLTYNWINANRTRTNILENVRIATDFGYATRSIMGDASQSSQVLEKFTGSKKWFYQGLLIGFRIQIERLTVFYNGVWIFRRSSGNVPGLTGGQVVSSIGFTADIFKATK